MVRISTSFNDEIEPWDCFWDGWLKDLFVFSKNSTIPSFKSAFDEEWKIIKACIVQGANINLVLKHFLHAPPRTGKDGIQLELRVDWTAMFILDKFFHHHLEFQEFAAAIEPKIMRPWRKIVSIEAFHSFEKIGRVYPSTEETEMLLPLFEKWENTSYPDDWGKLQLAMRRIWNAHEPEYISIGEWKENTDEKLVEKLDKTSIEDAN